MTHPTSSKRALVTGGTDGIGKAVAIELAKSGYAVDILGRNADRGDSALKAVNLANPNADHRLFLVDLASIQATSSFLEQYIGNNNSLDLMVLNANAYSKNLIVTDDDIERNFQVGCISRYMFSVALDKLLQAGSDKRVVHVGAMHKNVAKTASKIKYEELDTPEYGMMQSIWQSFAGSALIAHFLSQSINSPIAHQVFHPGIVNTRQVKEQNGVVRFLMRVFANLKEPNEVGKIMVDHILSTSSSEVAGQFYKLGKQLPQFPEITNGKALFDELIAYCSDVSGIYLQENILN